MTAPMPSARRVLSAGSWAIAPSDTITMRFDERHRRRIALTSDGGIAFLLDLAETTRLGDGDGLQLDDGRVVVVRAAAEALVEITAPDEEQLVRIAWQLGNRHLPVEVGRGWLRIRRERVIEDFVVSLGGSVRPIATAFDPMTSGAAHRH